MAHKPLSSQVQCQRVQSRGSKRPSKEAITTSRHQVKCSSNHTRKDRPLIVQASLVLEYRPQTFHIQASRQYNPSGKILLFLVLECCIKYTIMHNSINNTTTGITQYPKMFCSRRWKEGERPKYVLGATQRPNSCLRKFSEQNSRNRALPLRRAP
mgnify:CR=1 FL=1